MRNFFSIRTILAILFTSIIVLGGFLLPSSIFSLQSRSYLSNPDSYAIEHTQFHYASNLQDTLSLMQRNRFFVVNNSHTYKHSESEIDVLYHDIINSLANFGIDFSLGDSAYQDIKCYYMLETDTSDYSPNVSGSISSNLSETVTDAPSPKDSDSAAEYSFSSYVWYIHLLSEQEENIVNLELYLDDETGKLIGLSYLSSLPISALYEMTDETKVKDANIGSVFDDTAQNLAAFLASHYDFADSSSLINKTESDSSKSQSYICVFPDHDGNETTTSIFISENRLLYNPDNSYY